MRHLALLAGSFALVALIPVVSQGGSAVPSDLAMVQRSVRPGVGSDAPRPAARLSDHELAAAVDDLVAAVNPSRIENGYFPAFAKEQIGWVLDRAKAGHLAVVLLKDLKNTNLDSNDLMGSGVIDGKATILIVQARFERLLDGRRRSSAPFSERQKIDFMLGLVHEALHLQNPRAGDPANREDRIREESRVWRDVDVNVVRTLLQRHTAMDRRFADADDALRACRDQLPCERLTAVIMPALQ